MSNFFSNKTKHNASALKKTVIYSFDTTLFIYSFIDKNNSQNFCCKVYKKPLGYRVILHGYS